MHHRGSVMSTADEIAEELYFDVFDYVAERVEYFQPGADTRLLLPEFVTGFIVASIIKPLFEGASKRIGEKLGDKATDAALAALQKHANKPDDGKAVIDEIAANLPTILAEADRLSRIEPHIVADLTAKGLSRTKAELIARDVILLMQRRLSHE